MENQNENPPNNPPENEGEGQGDAPPQNTQNGIENPVVEGQIGENDPNFGENISNVGGDGREVE